MKLKLIFLYILSSMYGWEDPTGWFFSSAAKVNTPQSNSCHYITSRIMCVDRKLLKWKLAQKQGGIRRIYIISPFLSMFGWHLFFPPSMVVPTHTRWCCGKKTCAFNVTTAS